MARHNFDPKVFDYTWKQNRLAKDKEALKNSLMNIIQKKPKKKEGKADDVSRLLQLIQLALLIGK